MCHSFWGLSVCRNAVRSLVERVAGSGNTSPMERNVGSRNTSPMERNARSGNTGPMERNTGSRNTSPMERSAGSRNTGPMERSAGSGNTGPMERSAGSRNTSLTERITGCGNIRGGDRWFHDEDFSGIWNRFFVWGTVCRLCQSKGEDTFYRHGIFQSGEAFAVQQRTRG